MWSNDVRELKNHQCRLNAENLLKASCSFENSSNSIKEAPLIKSSNIMKDKKRVVFFKFTILIFFI